MFKSLIRLLSFEIGIAMTILMYILYRNGMEVPMGSMYFTVLPLCIFLGAHWIPWKDNLFDN